jgi:DNA-binding MarR family transcriptional regulator
MSRRPILLAELDAAMRKASAQGVLFSQAIAGRLGINSIDLECLDIIGLSGSVTAGQLAEATGLTTGAITGVIDRLEMAGYARRERDANDRRKVLVRALPAMERRIVPLFRSLQEAFGSEFGNYDDKELAFLVDFFARAHRIMIVETTKLAATLERDKKSGGKG